MILYENFKGNYFINLITAFYDIFEKSKMTHSS